MYDYDPYKMPNLIPSQREKLLRLKNHYLNPKIPFKRNSLSSKIANNVSSKINLAELIDINNRKNTKMPQDSMVFRSVSLNKPGYKLSNDNNPAGGLRQSYNNNGQNYGLFVNGGGHHKDTYDNQSIPVLSNKVTGNNNVLDNKHLIFNNNGLNNHYVGPKIVDNTHSDRECNKNNGFLANNSFKIKNLGPHISKGKFQPINPLNRNVLSGNAAKIKILSNDNKLKLIKGSNGIFAASDNKQKNELANSLSINQIDVHSGNVNLYNKQSKKPNTTTKLITTSNFFFNHNNLVKDYAFIEEQNIECRKTMEDYTRIVTNYIGDKNKMLFCLFDGHGGSDVASYLKEKLPEKLSLSLSDQRHTVEENITKTFQLIDEEFKMYDNVGSTACLVYISIEKEKRVFYAVNVGDSGIVLIKSTGAKKISYDHKCTDQKENERIKQSKGIIFGGRVFGQLALSRAFGDYALKNYGVYSIPYITRNIIEENDRYIIIASDGLFDVIDEDTLFNLSQTVSSADDFCKILITKAIKSGSLDNISCIAIKLN